MKPAMHDDGAPTDGPVRTQPSLAYEPPRIGHLKTIKTVVGQINTRAGMLNRREDSTAL
jgi:hypothetical protein